MYDEMMTSLLRVVLLPPLEGDDNVRLGLWEFASQETAASEVLEPTTPTTGGGWKNLLKWRAFTRKNREKILAECA